MKKYLTDCEAKSHGGPSQDVCSWYSADHCAEYNRGRNQNKCRAYLLGKRGGRLKTKLKTLDNKKHK